mmetsp:Transcript_96630/g.171846  ORF Transcript_96630/g.171846 Transcript_96630/m.171846 type:complete len:447 (+) Transcript_96630:63-1403(+)|eukprot:CAMPEP_0197664508 /NCGR_PEP_ID=MMETSP1338-20131121/58680_1 /TAXON_ID=43686 ORGANISM="Pelagodinium beii, Strain RCC1491" /NCGR_SAMPLE_ID=MMETSP1338 /ASSEMBLY_ACC=CAM_ASM_000754 /LENGTH=446 /DNA_ID=CAMNT_0043243167 /DNA_START=63 /DNA_END=1403 /DNA_ORIENTATION=-
MLNTVAAILEDLLRAESTVLPKSALVGLLSAGAAALLWHYWDDDAKGEDNKEVSGFLTGWSTFTFSLAFLIVFRSNQAYARYEQGTESLKICLSGWYTAISALFSCCSQETRHAADVKRFQQLLVRLASLLSASAFQSICGYEEGRLELVDMRGVSKESLRHLQSSDHRIEVILQWIQRLVTESVQKGALSAPSPLIGGALHELSAGFKVFSSARKVKDIKFPSAYTQVIVTLLVIHFTVTPVFVSQYVSTIYFAALSAFGSTGCVWALYLVSMEVDNPFADLPMETFQRDFNAMLLNLMHPLTHSVPPFESNSGHALVISKNGIGLPEQMREELKEQLEQRKEAYLARSPHHRFHPKDHVPEYGLAKPEESPRKAKTKPEEELPMESSQRTSPRLLGAESLADSPMETKALTGDVQQFDVSVAVQDPPQRDSKKKQKKAKPASLS